MAIARINRRFDAGKGVVRFDRPVISIGNLSVGGTGKTPMVRHIVRLLLEAGHRPCIAMRGYKGGDGSDEAAAYGREFPGVPVIAQANRAEGLMHLFGHEYDSDETETDCIILDDGFQHRRVARDLDIVLIDATRAPFTDRLLPSGWLREPVSSLTRAGLVVITHSESADAAAIGELDRDIAASREGLRAEAVARHAWAGLWVLESGAESERPTGWLRGRRTFAACAIGNPGPFLDMAAKAVGRPLGGSMVLRDHDPLSPATALRLIDQARQASADAILITDKDWSKLSAVAPSKWPCPVARPRLELAFDRGEELLRTAVLRTVARGAPA